jgi:hypothetical protein
MPAAPTNTVHGNFECFSRKSNPSSVGTMLYSWCAKIYEGVIKAINVPWGE